MHDLKSQLEKQDISSNEKESSQNCNYPSITTFSKFKIDILLK